MKPFRERNPVIVGAASIAVLVLLLVAALRAQDLPIIGGGDTYYASFTEAGGLKTGDPVRIAGVRVGKVEGITLRDGEVRVAFKIDTDAKLGDQTGASIEVATLLGSMFLSVNPSGSGELAGDATIPSSRTSSPFDVVDAFSGLAETSADIDTDQLAKSMTTLADLTRNTPEEFRSALSGVSRLSTNLVARNDQIDSLLKNLKRVSTVLDARDDDIIALMKDGDVLFRALIARKEQLHNLLEATSRLSVELTALVRQSRGDLKPALQHLHNVLDVLNKNDDNLNEGLRLMEPFYRVFTNTLGTGPWFDTFIENFPPLPGLPG